jgi:hypothetical protein
MLDRLVAPQTKERNPETVTAIRQWMREAPTESLVRTLDALAQSVGATFGVQERTFRTSEDGLWPAVVDRQLERRLVDVLGTRSTRAEQWRPLGPPFFLAGLAVTLASLPEIDRRKYLELAEALHPGSTEPHVYARWLATTPLPPARFLPMLKAEIQRAA